MWTFHRYIKFSVTSSEVYKSILAGNEKETGRLVGQQLDITQDAFPSKLSDLVTDMPNMFNKMVVFAAISCTDEAGNRMLYDKRNNEVAADVRYDGELDKLSERLGLTSVEANLYTIFVDEFKLHDIIEVNKVSNLAAAIKVISIKPVDESLDGYAALKEKYTNFQFELANDTQ